MTIPVFLNGFKIHKIVDNIILSPRTIGTQMNNVYADQGSNRHGQAFLYNTRGIKQISFDIYVRGSHQRFIDVTNEIASIIDVKEEVELILGDERDKVWTVLPTGLPSGTPDYSTSPPTYRGTLTFDVPSGRSESKNYTVLGTEKPSSINGTIETIGNMYHVELNNKGTSDMSPIFKFKHKTENGYIGIFGQNDEDYFTIGNKEEADTEVVKQSEVLFDYRDSKITDGLTASAKNVAILNDTSQNLVGTVASVDWVGRKHLFLQNAGGTTGNNAGSLTWDIPADSSGEQGSLNDYIWWRQVFWLGATNQYGFIKLTVSDTNGKFLYGVETFKRAQGLGCEYNFMASDGNGGYKIVKHWTFNGTHEDAQNPFNEPRGSSDLKRNDDKVRVYWFGSYKDFIIPEIKGRKSAKIHVAFGAIGNKPLVSRMYLDGICYRKDYVDHTIDIPNAYPADSEVEINMETGKIFVNGQNASNQHLDNSEFFVIDKGKYKLDIYFSSWIEQLPELEISWKERYS